MDESLVDPIDINYWAVEQLSHLFRLRCSPSHMSEKIVLNDDVIRKLEEDLVRDKNPKEDIEKSKKIMIREIRKLILKR
jgi:hypothetical protein